MNVRIAAPLSGAPRFSIMARALMFLGVLVLAGCAGRNDDFTVEPLRPAAVIYDEGVAAMEAGRFGDAIAAFEELERHYPYSAPARAGLALATSAFYRSGDYEEAIVAADRFLLLYPRDEAAAEVLFLKGESYLRQVPDITRDQEMAYQALLAHEELVERFPNSPFATQARLNIVAVRDQLAGQEMLIGRYYLERRDYVAAVNRFRTVVTEYQNTRHVEEALFRLTEAYLSMGLTVEAQTAAAVLGHNFPDSPWYKDAYDLLGAGGLSPNRNRGSWLSRIFG